MRTLIDAGPGTGKTRLLSEIPHILAGSPRTNWEPTESQKEILQYISEEYPKVSSPDSEEIIYTTFIKLLQTEGQEKFPSPNQSKTISALGRSFIYEYFGSPKFMPNRPMRLIESHLGKKIMELPSKFRSSWFAVAKICNMLRRELMEPSQESLDYLSKRYPPEKPWDQNILNLILPIWSNLKKYDGTVDYEDFCWLGHYYPDCYYPRITTLLIDECQDLSPVYYSFLRKVSQHQILVGDPHQAINGWNGADIHMFDKQTASSRVFYMKDCFRCPSNIVDMANRISQSKHPLLPRKDEAVPVIPVRPLVERVDKLGPGNTMIIGRYNAQLIQACITLRMKGIAAHLEGDKDVAGPIVSFAKMVTYGKFTPYLTNRMSDWIEESPLPDWAKMKYYDYRDCVEFVGKVDSFDDLKSKLQNLFKKRHSSFPLMSIHQSKGKEANHVLAVGPLAGFDDSEFSQEANCEFVGVTRTQHQLYQ